MQRPGCRRFATSVRTLTTGSQATAGLRLPGLISRDAGGQIAATASTAGMRIRIEVSARPSSRIEIVRVGTEGAGSAVTRSALAARLTVRGMPRRSKAGSAKTTTRPRSDHGRMRIARRRTSAKWRSAPRIPLILRDMAVSPSPLGDQRHNVMSWEQGPRTGDHLTVSKIFAGAGTSFGAGESFRQPVIPPAPLTGDVGRDCGDASRALLFWPKSAQITLAAPPSASPLVRPERHGSGPALRDEPGWNCSEKGIWPNVQLDHGRALQSHLRRPGMRSRRMSPRASIRPSCRWCAAGTASPYCTNRIAAACDRNEPLVGPYSVCIGRFLGFRSSGRSSSLSITNARTP